MFSVLFINQRFHNCLCNVCREIMDGGERVDLCMYTSPLFPSHVRSNIYCPCVANTHQSLIPYRPVSIVRTALPSNRLRQKMNVVYHFTRQPEPYSNVTSQNYTNELNGTSSFEELFPVRVASVTQLTISTRAPST